MPSFPGLGKFFGNAASETAAFAAGTAMSPTLRPLLQALANETWSKYPDMPPDAYALAEGVAQGQVDPVKAKGWASQQGIGDTQWAALVNIANVGPALGYAFEAWRRGFLTDDEFTTALNRTGLEPQWYAALRALKGRLLDPADLARGIHKSLIPDPGLLAVPQPSGTGKIPAYPVYPIDAVAAAAGFGYSKDQLGVLVGLQGNPMGAHEAAQAQFRGVIEPVDYDRAIAEGNTRNEWGDAIREQSRQIATSIEAVENHLRGYSDEPTMYERTGRHGMTEDDTTILFQNAGRPLTVHQITTGLARGGTFQPQPGELTDPYEAAVHESSIKPAYYELAIANKYTLPGYFVIKAMLSDNALTEAEAATIFRQEGWPPDIADKAAGALSGGTTATVSTHVKSSVTSAYTSIRKAYVGGAISRAQAVQHLTELGASTTEQAGLFKVWDVQRAVEASAAAGA